MALENHGLMGVGLDLYEEGGGTTPVHSERVNFLGLSSAGARSGGIPLLEGQMYRLALTPIGYGGGWAACAGQLVADGMGDAVGESVAPSAGGPPKAAFTFSPALPLPKEPVTFDASSSRDDGTIVSYAWTWGDGSTGSGRIAFHSYPAAGSYVVVLTVTDDTGKTNSASHTVRVIGGPTASFSFSPATPKVGDAVTFDASGTTDPDGNIASYRWDFGDGTPALTTTAPTTTHAYAAYGTYRVTLRVTDSDGLWSETSMRLSVYAPPVAAFTFTPSAPLVGEIVAFDGTPSTDPDSAIVSYAWSFGDGATGIGRTTTHAFAAGGTYSVSLTVTGTDGFASTAVRSLVVAGPPRASFSFTPLTPIVGEPVTFDASSSADPDGTIASYTWDFGDGTTGIGRVAQHTYALSGPYTVVLRVTDDEGLWDMESALVTVRSRPVASFVVDPPSPLVGSSVSFDASSSTDPDGTIASYTWDFGDGSPPVTLATAAVGHTFTSFGSYAVRLHVVDNDGLAADATQTVRVLAPPVADFTYTPAEPLSTKPVTFDASSSTDPDGTIASYAWDFGDGGSGTGSVATHAYADGGTFVVTLTVTDSDGLVTRRVRSVDVTRYDPKPPAASFTISPIAPKVGDLVTFDASGTTDPDVNIASYRWDFGDGSPPSTVSVRQVTHAYGMHGTYRVTLRVTDADGLWSEMTSRLTVFAPPAASFIFAPSAPLVGDPVTFDASSSTDPDSAIVAYDWDFGDGSRGSGRVAQHAYGRFGTLIVTLTVLGSDGFGATATKSIRILVRPSASFAYSPAKPLEGQPVAFDASGSSDPDGTIASYTWDFGDGTAGSGRLVSHPYALFGTYTVRLTVTDADGLTASVSQSVRILAPPTASFTYSPAAPLVGQTVSFDGSESTDRDGSIASWSWSFGDGSSATGRLATHAYPGHGTFSVLLTVTDNEGLQSTKTVSLRILAPPSASFSFTPAKPTEGSVVAFDASGSSDPDGTIASYAWDFGDGATGSGSEPSHAYARFGTYTVTLTVRDNDGLTATSSKALRILAPPQAFFVFAPSAPLEGEAVSFDGSASADPDGTIGSYAWTFGDATTGNGAVLSHVYGRFGTYSVTLTVVDSDGLTASVGETIRIHARPIASFTFSPAKPLEGQSTSFDGRASSDPDGTVASYSWDFGDGTTGSGSRPAHTYARFGVYTVSLTVTDNDGLTGTTSLGVRIHALPSASFVSSPSRPLEGASVSFDASASTDPDGTIAAYRWTWGDGTTSGDLTGPTTSHRYTLFGTYGVTLVVVDADGFTAQVTQTIRVYAAPIASFTFTPSNPRSGQTVTFDGSGSSDRDGTIAAYRWTWGDGSPATDAATPIVSHVFAAFGTFSVILRVTDADGFTAETTRQVRVLAPPTASFTYTPLTPTFGQRVSFDGSSSSDPDGTIVSYAWAFGDGTTASGPTASHVYPVAGSYPVSLTVTDDDGLSATRSVTLTVSAENKPPTAAFTLARTLMSVTVDASMSSDPEQTIASYTWTWGDGTIGSGVTASHTYSAGGAYSIGLTVTDGGGLTATATQATSVGPWTVDYEFTDFLNVPYGEWWDYRRINYGDRAMNAECFNATAVSLGVCTPGNDAVRDVASAPYTNWHPRPPGGVHPFDPDTNAFVFGPYRMHAAGDDVPGYTLSAPVFLPTLGASSSAGSFLDFDWRVGYLDTASATSLEQSGCLISRYDLDGWVTRSLLTLRMDLQQSRRTFGVSASTVQDARNWWSSNISPGCFSEGAVERAWGSFMMAQGGGSSTVGPYDIINAFGWWYDPFYTAMTATVADDGTTTVTIDHAAWGTELLLARWFYWGPAAYKDFYLDSTQAQGWIGLESPYEDLAFRGRLRSASMDATLDAVVQYQFREGAQAGTNGIFDRVDDVPVWSWGPTLADFMDGTLNYSLGHTPSELKRYAGLTYVHTTPGSIKYGVPWAYEYVPATWNLRAGHTWTFRMSSGPFAFHDPNLTPLSADPSRAMYVQMDVPPVLAGTFPIPIGTWDPVTRTLRVFGPVTTGGSPGSPSGGYPEQPYPGVVFRP